MNTTLKSSTLIPLERKSTDDSQLDRSLSLVKSASHLNRPNQQQKQAIAQIYIEQAWIYFKERNWRDAFSACKNALNMDRQNTDAYKILGNILKIKGKKAEALGIYAKALEINPNSATIYANLGSFHAEQQNWQQALDYYQQAVIIDPSLAGAYRNLARVWEELEDNERALECLCQAVNLEPQMLSAEEYFDFSDRLHQQGQLKEASIFLIHGVELEPQENRLAQLVRLLEQLEEWQQAVIYYHRLISLSDGKLPAKKSLAKKPIGNLLTRSRSLKATPARTQKAIAPSSHSTSPQLLPNLEQQGTRKTKPGSATSWNNLGSSYAQKNQWAKAISCYQEAIELNPQLSKTYRNLARVYQKIGKKDRAILCWYEAFNLKPQLVKSEEHFNLAQQLLQLQHQDKAIACLHHALALDPNFERASLMLDKLTVSQDKLDAASDNSIEHK